jgi:hypothetical protein
VQKRREGTQGDVTEGARTYLPLAGLIATASVVLSGCGAAPDSDAESAASHFLAAAQHGDGQAACALLAPETRSELEQSSSGPCAKAVLDEKPGSGSVEKVSVFETMAQVKFTSGVVFLSRFDSGWLVTAAACSPVPNRPYDCSIQAG